MKDTLKKENLFYIPWILMVIHLCIANSNAYGFSISLVSYFCALLFVMKIIWTGHYSTKQMIFMAVLFATSALATLKSKDKRFLWFALTLCASKDISFDKLVKCCAVTMLVCCICILTLYSLGIIEGYQSISKRGLRLGFGLGHPNMCSAYYSLLSVYYLYLHYEKINIQHIVALSIGSLVLYCFTKSNTGFVVFIFSIITFFVLKYVPHKKVNAQLVFMVLVSIIVLFTLMPIMYSDKLLLLDSAMTGRLHQSYYYYSKYGVSLFGNDVSPDLLKWNTDNILDLGYARMLIYNGFAYYVIVVGGYIICLFNALKKNNRKLLILLGSMIMYTAAENVATYVFMNASMLALADIIFVGKKGKKYERQYS